MRHVAGEFDRRKPFEPAHRHQLCARPHAVSGFFGRPLCPPSCAGGYVVPAACRFARVSRRAAHTGAQSRSLNRSVSGLRNFARFLERRDTPVSPAFNLLSVPKTTRSLPRPVARNDALAMIRLALESASAVWVGRRDAALLCLLYGAGLRVSEALQLDVKSLPPTQDRALRILGKGNKERQVPLLPIIRQTLDDYMRAAPFGFAPEDPVFVAYAVAACRRARPR